jgi:hypothetical protein
MATIAPTGKLAMLSLPHCGQYLNWLHLLIVLAFVDFGNAKIQFVEQGGLISPWLWIAIQSRGLSTKTYTWAVTIVLRYFAMIQLCHGYS